MAKRSLDDPTPAVEEGRVSKKVRNEQKIKTAIRRPTDPIQNGELNGHSNDTSANEVVTKKGDEISKADRKALRRARKEQAKLDGAHISAEDAINGTGGIDAVAKAERKALKRAAKAARNIEKAALDSTSEPASSAVDTPGTTTRDTSEGREDIAYHEDEELAALPQNEIDAFVLEHRLTIEDTLKQTFRPLMSFECLPGDVLTQDASFVNFAAPTPIQAGCWPYLFAGRDVVGVAETGSGKTLAFGVPCIRYISLLGKRERRGIKACIVSPTRELAMQIYEQLAKLAEPVGLKVTCVYGGVSKNVQRETLNGTHILVATPGRLNDFIQEGSIDLSKVNYLVLDEADRMLDKGFEDEVRKIISTTPSTGRQTLMFTATWPPSVRDLAGTFMDIPVKVTIGDNASGELRANAKIIQEVEVIEDREKQPRLIQLLKQYQSGKNKNDRILVFCLYKKEATRIEDFIRRKGFSVAGIHGDLNQHKRTESLDAFKRGQVPLLVATDVAARGLDIPAVKVVINVTFPLTVEDYVHRIGRSVRPPCFICHVHVY